MDNTPVAPVTIDSSVISDEIKRKRARQAMNSRRYRERHSSKSKKHCSHHEHSSASASDPVTSLFSIETESIPALNDTSTTVEKAVASIESKGYYITEYNKDLDIFIDGFYSIFNIKDRKMFQFDIDITGNQKQYIMKHTYAKDLWLTLEMYMKDEINMVNEYFKKRNDGINKTNIKFTTNHSDNIIIDCSEQYPHQDVLTNNYVFVIVVLSPSVIGTNIYGTLDQFSQLKTKQEVIDFFTLEPISLKRGQCLILRPNIIHAGPAPGLFQRDLMYLEYTGTTVTNKVYDQIFMNEYDVPKYYMDALNELHQERKWIYPSDKDKNKPKISLPVSIKPIQEQQVQENNDNTLVNIKIKVKMPIYKPT